MKIAWVTRSFLDYRVPVFRELDRMVGGDLHLFYSGDYVPEGVSEKALAVLGGRAHPLTGEVKWGAEDRHFHANRNFSIRWQPDLIRAIRELNPDVIVCDGFFKWTLPALIYKIRTSTPIVINYERTHHTERHAQRIRTLYRRIIVKLTDAMDCSGSLCREYSEYLGMPAERITTGHMSADTGSLAEEARVATAHRQELREKFQVKGVMFLYVGRLMPLKGCMQLLKAWKKAIFSPEEASLVVVGEGEQRRDLESMISEYELQNVHLTGRVPYEELAGYYAAANAFVIATLEDNWSLVVPEAMACGLPILSSKYNGCWPDLVHEGVNGWVFDPLNQESLVQSLKAAVRASDELKDMGKRSTQMVLQHGPEQAALSIYEACQIALSCKQK